MKYHFRQNSRWQFALSGFFLFAIRPFPFTAAPQLLLLLLLANYAADFQLLLVTVVIVVVIVIAVIHGN